MGMELDLRNRSWFETAEGPTTQGTTLSKRPTEGPRRKARFSHTLCTCGADASRAERGYLIGVRRSFSVEHCLHMRLRALTACRLTWRNSIPDKGLRARNAITAERSRFFRRSDARLRSVSRGRSRPTKSASLILDGAPANGSFQKSIGRNAGGNERAPWVERRQGGDAVKPPPDRFDLLAVGHSRSRSR